MSIKPPDDSSKIPRFFHFPEFPKKVKKTDSLEKFPNMPIGDFNIQNTEGKSQIRIQKTSESFKQLEKNEKNVNKILQKFHFFQKFYQWFKGTSLSSNSNWKETIGLETITEELDRLQNPNSIYSMLNKKQKLEKLELLKKHIANLSEIKDAKELNQIKKRIEAFQSQFTYINFDGRAQSIAKVMEERIDSLTKGTASIFLNAEKKLENLKGCLKILKDLELSCDEEEKCVLAKLKEKCNISISEIEKGHSRSE